MDGPEIPDSRESEVEIEVEPTVTARIARWLERARILGRRIEAARANHTSVDLGFDLV
jgi:hypothetical protein